VLRRYFLIIVTGVALGVVSACAQNESGGVDAGSCALKDHIYTCDGARFHEALQSAQNVAVEVHNWDGVGRAQLKDLVTVKLGKELAGPGTNPDLIFYMIPIDGTGIVSTSDADLGTLRIYSSTPDGARGHLLWAETYSGAQVPWPAVVHGLIRQFESHFQIK
jgi:hypothetical protein